MKGSQSLITYVFLERSVLGNRLDNTAAAQMSGETWLNDPEEKNIWTFQQWPLMLSMPSADSQGH